MTKVTLDDLVSNGAHFGHQAKRWNPKMEKYIYDVKEGSHIFDVTQTKVLLEEALDFLSKSVKEGKTVLFLGTKKQAKVVVKEVAEEVGAYYMTERWLGGLFTNFDQIKKSVKKLSEMKEKREKGEYGNRTKKERVLIDREIERLERFFGGLKGINQIPDIIFIIDTKKEFSAVKEAMIKNVVTIGIVDSNADPDKIDYPIPMNDDASSAIEYVMGLVKNAMLQKTVKKEKPKKSSDKSTKKKSKAKK